MSNLELSDGIGLVQAAASVFAAGVAMWAARLAKEAVNNQRSNFRHEKIDRAIEVQQKVGNSFDKFFDSLILEDLRPLHPAAHSQELVSGLLHMSTLFKSLGQDEASIRFRRIADAISHMSLIPAGRDYNRILNQLSKIDQKNESGEFLLYWTVFDFNIPWFSEDETQLNLARLLVDSLGHLMTFRVCCSELVFEYASREIQKLA